MLILFCKPVFGDWYLQKDPNQIWSLSNELILDGTVVESKRIRKSEEILRMINVEIS